MRLEEVESRLKDSEYKEEARSEMKVSRGGEREVARRKEKGRWHVPAPRLPVSSVQIGALESCFLVGGTCPHVRVSLSTGPGNWSFRKKIVKRPNLDLKFTQNL